MEQETQTTAPESSPGTEVKTEVPEYESPDLETFTPEQRSEWLSTGKVPAKEKSATSEPEKAESAPAKTEEPQPDSRKPQTAETRKAQLHNEIQELLEQRRQLREEVARAALPAPKPEPQPGATTQERPKRPKFADFDGDWEKYEESLAEYEDKLTDYKVATRIDTERQKLQQEIQQRQEQAAQTELQNRWDSGIEKVKEKYSDYDAVIDSAGNVPLTGPMAQYMLYSEFGPEIGYYLAKNQGEALRITKLQPFQVLTELAKIEVSLGLQLQASGTPKPKRVSASNAPPTTLTGVNKAPEDEAQAALESGDFMRYREVMNARELAQRARRQ